MKKVLFIASLFLIHPALAQENNPDNRLQECLDGASSTLSMSQCYAEANKAWDKEMNNQYTQLMKKLTGEPKDKLRAAQRAWLTYRDSWLAASSTLYRSTQGTMATLSVGAQGVSLVRNQALMLKSLSEGRCANPDDCR